LAIASHLWNEGNLNGESYNFGPPAQNNITVMELLKKLGKSWNLDDSEDLYIQTGELKFHEVGLLQLNCDKALYDFKWQPTLDIQELIEFTGDWYYNYYHKQEDVVDFTTNQIFSYEQKAFEKKIRWAHQNSYSPLK
jgi:CDP-glucose 4,6-dehydratase